MVVNMGKNIQIPQELFFDLVRYFVLEDISETRYKAISDAVSTKFDKMVNHELYSVYKTAETAEERDKARKEYLDRVGMRDSFRW
jgi:hypothetical protein